jgi:hypothetical protein
MKRKSDPNPVVDPNVVAKRLVQSINSFFAAGGSADWSALEPLCQAVQRLNKAGDTTMGFCTYTTPDGSSFVRVPMSQATCDCIGGHFDDT